MTDSTRSQERQIVTRNPDWPIGGSLPNPVVQMFFWGIMGFRYDPVKRECEIGIHHGSPTHSFKVLVLEDLSNTLYSSNDEYPSGLPVQMKFEFEVVNRTPDVTFLQSEPFDRTDQSVNRNDFRWLIDFEAPDFYGFRLPMNERVFRKRLYVRNGTFYTLAPSCATFDVVGGPHPQNGIHVSRYIGANLDLRANECAILKVNGVPKLPANQVCGGLGKTYQFFFVNSCDRAGGCRDSDFHQNFDAVAIPHDQRFELVLNEACEPCPPDPIEQMFSQKGELKVLDVLKDITPLNTDEGACMGTGYGSGGAMPTFPPG